MLVEKVIKQVDFNIIRDAIYILNRNYIDKYKIQKELLYNLECEIKFNHLDCYSNDSTKLHKELSLEIENLKNIVSCIAQLMYSFETKSFGVLKLSTSLNILQIVRFIDMTVINHYETEEFIFNFINDLVIEYENKLLDKLINV